MLQSILESSVVPRMLFVSIALVEPLLVPAQPGSPSTARHAIFATEGGYSANNPGQGWQARFDGTGFTARPRAGGWTWGLELRSYGFSGHESPVALPERVRAEGRRVTYDWDSVLSEWFVNDSRGLEHGFTVHRRPDRAHGGDAAGSLSFRLEIRGGLEPKVQADGRGARFVDSSGTAVVTYTGLKVFDATGCLLPAWLDAGVGELTLSVDERGACYPLTIDPLVQQAYLKASNAEEDDCFGQAVAISGETVVVGAQLEDGGATGVNGDEGNGTFDSGAAYVFVRSVDSAWSQQAYLKASNTGLTDRFGASVAICNDTIVIGAPREQSNATGVDGDGGNDDAGFGTGAAYVFVRSGTDWSQQAYLKASNTGGGDFFGASVAVSGDTLVVGAWGEDSGATGVNGSQGIGAFGSGAAYVFVRDGTVWSQQAYLKASNTELNDEFGSSVAISGDTVVVGALREDSGATGVGGDQSDNSAPQAGAAYVFVRSGTSWSQQAYLKASNTEAGDRFGSTVSISGDTLLASADRENSGSAGVDGDQSDNSVVHAGAAYVFVRSGSTWSQQAYLKASNPGLSANFGISLEVSGETVVVGARDEASSASGVNGPQDNTDAPSAGAAYVFVRTDSIWSQQAYLKASNAELTDEFGAAVSVSGDTVVVGADSEDSGATGVNGDQADESEPGSGAAYVFERPCSTFVPSAEVVRSGVPPNPTALLPGQTYGPLVGTVWDPIIDHTSFMPTAVLDFLAFSLDPGNVPTSFGTMLCVPMVTPLVTLASEPYAIPIPLDCSFPGQFYCVQGGSWDGTLPLNGSSFALTNALDITIGTF